jgi:UDP-glucose 4-epimerase
MRHRLSHFIRRFNYKNNVLGSITLINQAVKDNIRCFLFTSSIAVYGFN